MTEAEWNACTEPAQMLDFLRGKAATEIAGSLTVGWLRTTHPEPPPTWVGHTLEKHADGLATPAELSSPHASWVAGKASAAEAYLISARARTKEERVCLASLLRCVGPLLFHSIVLDPTWLTAAVTQLAAATYEERTFDRMPILGDALDKLAVANADILNHCRQPGEHVRGCWVVDLLLGKE